MSAPATAILRVTACSPSRARAFRRRVESLEAKYSRLWSEADDSPLSPSERVGRRTQRANARHCQRFIDQLAHDLEALPDDDAERRRWRQRVQKDIRRLGEERFGWPAGYRDLLVADEFFAATVEFARSARRFEESIGVEDVSQALRNVWIVNSLQMLLDLEVALTPAVFAYSMLYPYTDNYLDDPGIELGSKQGLNRGLRVRLAGGHPRATDERQAAVFRLVAMIEEQFPRHLYPDVFSSLEAILRGQVRSLQQQPPARRPEPAEALSISVAKGGASVLADGYLAAGSLGPAEEDFCFAYGVFLQLLDDLQDVARDLEVGNWTLFSLAAGADRLDRTTSRLYRFIHRAVASSERFAAPRYAQRKDLIVRNCTGLLMGAVAENPGLFSRRFRRQLQNGWPLRFRAMRRLRSRASYRLRRAAEALCRAKGVESVFELLELDTEDLGRAPVMRAAPWTTSKPPA